MALLSQKGFSLVAGIIFLVIAVLHLLRAVLGWSAVIGSFNVPVWFSWIAVFAAAFLAYSGFKLAK
ncbi:hypothetical protein HYU12_03655 [Candidatus Woesearchaeota archaeon]|nr:hypothetical protein [Candidatus Woesearchaeota archaeon]